MTLFGKVARWSDYSTLHPDYSGKVASISTFDLHPTLVLRRRLQFPLIGIVQPQPTTITTSYLFIVEFVVAVERGVPPSASPSHWM